MARIRTIKPEFPQSETIGKLSRDARLLFIQLWTIADDYGRCRAAPRMLASLLYPYDDDAPKLMPEWLAELTEAGCILTYRVDGDSYLEIVNWAKHQRVDNAGKSTIPEPSADPSSDTIEPGGESPRAAASRREPPRAAANVGESPRFAAGPGPGPGPRTRTKDLERDSSSAVASDPSDPSDEAVGFWNELASELRLPKVQRLTPARATLLAARLRECGGIEGWRLALVKIRGSPFLRGELPRGNGHENWRCNFDWLISQRGFTKLMEGNFDRGHENYRNGFAAILAEAEQRAAGGDLGERPELEATVIDAG